MFILATTEAHKIPVTILSRCQRYDFHRITVDTIAGRLTELLEKEGVDAEEKAVRYIARAGDGSMRDALSLLDQCIAFYLGEKLTYDKVLDVLGAVDVEVYGRLLREILAGNVSGTVGILSEMVTGGRDLGQFVTDFTWYLRNLLLIRTSEDPEDVVDASSENLLQMKEESRLTEPETLMRYIRVLSELSGQIRYAAQKRVLVEVGLIRLCRPQMETGLDSLLDRIRVLERRIEEAPKVVYAPEKAASAGGRAETPEPQTRKPAPEELQKIVASWGVFVNQTSGGLQAVLHNAVPKYNPASGEAVLYVEFPDLAGGAYVERPEFARELSGIIRRQTGLDVEVRFVMADAPESGPLSEISVEDALREHIHFDVDIEDDEGFVIKQIQEE